MTRAVSLDDVPVPDVPAPKPGQIGESRWLSDVGVLDVEAHTVLQKSMGGKIDVMLDGVDVTMRCIEASDKDGYAVLFDEYEGHRLPRKSTHTGQVRFLFRKMEEKRPKLKVPSAEPFGYGQHYFYGPASVQLAPWVEVDE